MDGSLIFVHSTTTALCAARRSGLVLACWTAVREDRYSNPTAGWLFLSRQQLRHTGPLYALRVLRHHGMTEIGLHAVFRAVVVSRLTYASPAWSGFITATDRQRVDAVISRSKRCGFCPPDMPDFKQLLEDADDQRFERILNNPHHTLYHLLPPQSAASQNYNLRRRTHDRQLHEHQAHLSDCNFYRAMLCIRGTSHGPVSVCVCLSVCHKPVFY